MSKAALSDMASKEPERFDALERAGFKTERYGNIQEHILVRLGGHYIDVGASKMIADGLVPITPECGIEDELIVTDVNPD